MHTVYFVSENQTFQQLMLWFKFFKLFFWITWNNTCQFFNENLPCGHQHLSSTIIRLPANTKKPVFTLCSSRKYTYSPPEKGLEFPGGLGVLQAQKILIKEMYEVYLEFPGAWGSHPWGRYGYFLELQIEEGLCLQRL